MGDGVAGELLARGQSTSCSPAESVLVDVARMITERPWAVSAGDFARMIEAGFPESTVLHTVLQSGLYNYLNRVADAVNIEFDYDLTLEPFKKDVTRAPAPRPSVEDWPVGPAWPLRLRDRPTTAEALHRLEHYLMSAETGLGAQERRLLACAVAEALCDQRSLEKLGRVRSTQKREQILAEYATRLTVTPWLVTEADVMALRGLGLADLDILHAIAVVSFQNLLSRVALVIEVE